MERWMEEAEEEEEAKKSERIGGNERGTAGQAR
jgi:hypothetical protein